MDESSRLVFDESFRKCMQKYRKFESVFGGGFEIFNRSLDVFGEGGIFENLSQLTLSASLSQFNYLVKKMAVKDNEYTSMEEAKSADFTVECEGGV